MKSDQIIKIAQKVVQPPRTASPLLDAANAVIKTMGLKQDMKEQLQDSEDSIMVPLSDGKRLTIQIK